MLGAMAVTAVIEARKAPRQLLGRMVRPGQGWFSRLMLAFSPLPPADACAHFPGLPANWPLTAVVAAVVVVAGFGGAGFDRLAFRARLRRFRIGAGVSCDGPQHSLLDQLAAFNPTDQCRKTTCATEQTGRLGAPKHCQLPCTVACGAEPSREDLNHEEPVQPDHGSAGACRRSLHCRIGPGAGGQRDHPGGYQGRRIDAARDKLKRQKDFVGHDHFPTMSAKRRAVDHLTTQHRPDAACHLPRLRADRKETP